jgi:hypothetical protein
MPVPEAIMRSFLGLASCYVNIPLCQFSGRPPLTVQLAPFATNHDRALYCIVNRPDTVVVVKMLL